MAVNISTVRCDEMWAGYKRQSIMKHWAGKQCFNGVNILNMVENLSFLWPINGPFCILVSELSIFLWTHPEQYSLSHPLLLIGHPC